jgi:hypothetical protein
MTDRTRQIIGALLTTPDLMQALKQDPAALASRLGLGGGEGPLLAMGQQLLSNLANRLRSGESAQPGPPSIAKPKRRGTNGDGWLQLSGERNSGSEKGASALPIVGVTSLAAIAGALAVLGTVSIVAISRDDGDNRG